MTWNSFAFNCFIPFFFFFFSLTESSWAADTVAFTVIVFQRFNMTELYSRETNEKTFTNVLKNKTTYTQFENDNSSRTTSSAIYIFLNIQLSLSKVPTIVFPVFLFFFWMTKFFYNFIFTWKKTSDVFKLT